MTDTHQAINNYNFGADLVEKLRSNRKIAIELGAPADGEMIKQLDEYIAMRVKKNIDLLRLAARTYKREQAEIED